MLQKVGLTGPIVLFCLALSHPATAQKGFSSVAAPSCKSKVENLIKSITRAMGLKKKYSLALTEESGGVDSAGKALTIYRSKLFTEDGYISFSNAELTVRTAANACETIRVDISIGV